MCGRPVLLRALDGPPASVVSRAGVGAPIELGDDRRVLPLPAEGRLIGSSLTTPVPSSTRGGPAPRSAAAATPSQQLYLEILKIRVESRRERVVEGSCRFCIFRAAPGPIRPLPMMDPDGVPDFGL